MSRLRKTRDKALKVVEKLRTRQLESNYDRWPSKVKQKHKEALTEAEAKLENLEREVK